MRQVIASIVAAYRAIAERFAHLWRRIRRSRRYRLGLLLGRDLRRNIHRIVAWKLKPLMQSLVYPAFLGTFLVFFFQHLEKAPLAAFDWSTLSTWWPLSWRVNEWMQVWTLLYFITLFVVTETTDSERYGAGTAIVDMVEVGIMCIAFRCLGYTGGAEHAGQFYVMMAVALLLAILWRFVSKRVISSLLNALCVTGIAVLAIGVASHRDDLLKPLDSRDIPVALVLWLLMAIYITILVTTAWFYNRHGGHLCLLQSTYQLVGVNVRHEMQRNGENGAAVPRRLPKRLSAYVEINGVRHYVVFDHDGITEWKLVGKEPWLLR